MREVDGPVYGTVACLRSPPAVARRGWRSKTPALCLALLAGVCLGALLGAAHFSKRSSVSVLVSFGDSESRLDSDAAQIANIGDEINRDLKINDLLHANPTQLAMGLKQQGHCACDCDSQPLMSTKANSATMLEQVGENIFLGPCSGCPCMRKNDVESIVDALGRKLVKIEAHEKVISKLEPGKEPVEITVAVGQKGQPGAQGPVGFQGPDGPVGNQGPPGNPGPPGPRGKTGPQGPRGPKGNDGKTGPPGRQGRPGEQGIQGPPGTEGKDGGRGSSGAAGTRGRNGPSGSTGQRGSRGDAAPAVGPRGPTGEPGAQGPKGNKGAQGMTGDKGFVGGNGPDGADGSSGNMGERGSYGRGCDGVRVNAGQIPKTIDACGVCGGDESECSKSTTSRTAHSVGDPHYLTFDYISFDYQITGEFILARHMNDIELQAKQIPCPNSRVRCNIGAAVVTKNWNLQFLSELTLSKIKVNGEIWTEGNQYRNGVKKTLDSTTSLLVSGRVFYVYFNDQKVGDGAVVFGYQNRWGNPLPNQLYMDLYFQAPARWGSGLSMTGLYANFDNNRNDDWEAISPSEMWWVMGTPSSAFANPTYLLDDKNRITKKTPKPWQAASGTSTLAEVVERRAFNALGDPVLESAWTREQELKAFKEVDPLTAKMRRRLFAKMAAEGVIERKPGEKAPTTGLAAAELDIMPVEGMRPDHLRIEQQMLFRKEWKSMSLAQRTVVLAGEISSSNAFSMERMCRECVKGSEDCVKKEIVTKPKAVGIMYKDAAEEKSCANACLPWLDPSATKAVCKCKIDCSLGVQLEQCTKNAVTNYVKARTSWFIPAKGKLDLRCINLNAAPTKIFKATDEGQSDRLWVQDKAFNFAVTFWWRPNPGETYEDEGIKSLIYKGPITSKTAPVVPEKKPLHIQVDGTNKDTPELLVTVAGQQERVPFAKCPTLKDDVFTFIAVTKRDQSISVWCGADNKDACEAIMGKTVATDEIPCYKKVHTFDLEPAATYETSKTQAIYLVSPLAKPAEIPKGFMGKFAYMASGSWDPTGKVPLWDQRVPEIAQQRQPSSCGE